MGRRITTCWWDKRARTWRMMLRLTPKACPRLSSVKRLPGAMRCSRMASKICG